MKRYSVVSTFAVLFASYPAFAQSIQEEVISRLDLDRQQQQTTVQSCTMKETPALQQERVRNRIQNVGGDREEGAVDPAGCSEATPSMEQRQEAIRSRLHG